MAQLGQTFDSNQHEPSAPMDLLPPGKYVAHIVKSDMVDTSAGQMLKLEFDVLEGQFKNRKLWTNLNLVHTNPQAVEIAQRDLSAICRAVNKLAISDSEALHHIPLMVTVKIKPAGPDKNNVQRDAQNEVKGYEAAPRAGTYTPPPARAAAAPAATTAPAATVAATSNGPAAKRPWAR